MAIDATYNEMLVFSEIVADAIIKKVMPQKDDISTREAYQNYGRAWVERQVALRLVHPHTKGQCVVFSRHELDTLRAAERTPISIVSKKYKLNKTL